MSTTFLSLFFLFLLRTEEDFLGGEEQNNKKSLKDFFGGQEERLGSPLAKLFSLNIYKIVVFWTNY
jgi:hypothetical protein